MAEAGPKYKHRTWFLAPIIRGGALTQRQGMVQLELASAYYRAPRGIGGELRAAEVASTRLNSKNNRNPSPRHSRHALFKPYMEGRDLIAWG